MVPSPYDLKEKVGGGSLQECETGCYYKQEYWIHESVLVIVLQSSIKTAGVKVNGD